jgi:hypothetical protein
MRCRLVFSLPLPTNPINSDTQQAQRTPMELSRLEELEAWQQARELVKLVYAAIDENSQFKKDFRLLNHIQCAAVSVMSNTCRRICPQERQRIHPIPLRVEEFRGRSPEPALCRSGPKLYKPGNIRKYLQQGRTGIQAQLGLYKVPKQVQQTEITNIKA